MLLICFEYNTYDFIGLLTDEDNNITKFDFEIIPCIYGLDFLRFIIYLRRFAADFGWHWRSRNVCEYNIYLIHFQTIPVKII